MQVGIDCLSNLKDSVKKVQRGQFFNGTNPGFAQSHSGTQSNQNPFNVKSRFIPENNALSNLGSSNNNQDINRNLKSPIMVPTMNQRNISPGFSSNSNNSSQSNQTSQNNSFNPFSNSGHGFLSYQPKQTTNNTTNFSRPSLSNFSPPVHRPLSNQPNQLSNKFDGNWSQNNQNSQNYQNEKFNRSNSFNLNSQSNQFSDNNGRLSQNGGFNQSYQNNQFGQNNQFNQSNQSNQSSQPNQINQLSQNISNRNNQSPYMSNNINNNQKGNGNGNNNIIFNFRNDSGKSQSNNNNVSSSNTHNFVQEPFKTNNLNSNTTQEQPRNPPFIFKSPQHSQQQDPQFSQSQDPPPPLPCPNPTLTDIQFIKMRSEMQTFLTNTFIPLIQMEVQKKRIQEQEKSKIKMEELWQQELRRRQYRSFDFDLDDDDDGFGKKINKRERIVVNIVQLDQNKVLNHYRRSKQFLKEFIQECEGQHMIKNKKQQLSSTKQERLYDEPYDKDCIQVSTFPQFWKLQYSADLRWIQEPEIIRKNFSKSFVEVPERFRDIEIDEAILTDLRLKGQNFREGFIIKVHDVDFKRYKPNIIMRYIFGRKQKEFKEYVANCTVFEKKINLPSQYTYTPSIFKGFQVQNLEIRNQFGSMTWPGTINIKDVSFLKGLTIGKGLIICHIAQLQKTCIVEFNGLLESINQKPVDYIYREIEKWTPPETEIMSIDKKKKSFKLRIDLSKKSQLKIQMFNLRKI